jgi:hypothetical protein
MFYPKANLVEIEQDRPGLVDRVFSALQRSSEEDLLNEGRVYAGGLNKVEPRELARLRLQLDDGDVSLLREVKKPAQLELFALTSWNGGR